MQETSDPEKNLFDEAVVRTDSAQREAFLLAACPDNDLRRRVESLLKAHDEAGSFMQGPRDDFRPTTLCETDPVGLGTVIDHYKLLEKLGEGGFGVVWAAEQREPVKRRVAVKVIKLGMDTRQVIARFEAERQALALMDHANIARVFDAGATETGRPYFVMELVRGIPITTYCDQEKLSTGGRLGLFMTVCRAIQHAHQKGIIHRDIKPSNILVTLHDGVPVPKVIDFGIAKAIQQELTEKTIYTQFQQFIGTPAYMSPEQAEMSGLDIDTRSDIYSLGVLLYELLTGTTPFDAKELMRSGLDEMRKIIREREPLTPSSRLTMDLQTKTARSDQSKNDLPRSAIDRDLDWIVMKCLEKDRTRRYETASSLAQDLKRHLENEPVTARPPSAAYKFQKAFRRNKVMFLASAAVAVALAFGLGAATVMFFRERAARNGEQQQRLEAESAQKMAEAEGQRAEAQARKASESELQSRRLLYASDMNLAQQTLMLNNLGRARRLLDRHKPQPGEEDLRGWEWRYLWQLTRSTAVTLTNRPVRGVSVSFSPDGRRLAVGWYDGHVDLWDVPGRRRVRALTDSEHRHRGRVAFSPVRNLLAATSEPKVIALYNLDSGRESILWRAPDQGTWDVRDLAFSPDGSRLVIYAGSTPELRDAVWVMNVSSSQIERHHPTGVYSGPVFPGSARLSADNRRLYLARSDYANSRYSIQCIELATGQELWQTEPQRDNGLTTLAISPNGQVLVSGSGYADPTIRVWDAATGRLLHQLDGHTSWVGKLSFTSDGRRLISAGGDQSIRFWDTNNWTETKVVLRGHTDEVHAVAISDTAQLVASAGKDGNLMLWKEDGKIATDGSTRLPENLRVNEVLPLDHSRLLLLPPGEPPEWVDLKRDSLAVSLPEIGPSTNVLGWFGANILCHWNGTNQILVSELRGAELIQRGAVTLDRATRPTGFTYNPTRQLLAWTEESSSATIYLASLAAPGRRIELRSDVSGLLPFRFSQDGNYLAASTKAGESLRAWSVETGQIVASIGGLIRDATFAAGGRVLVVAINKGNDHETVFYDLVHPGQAPRCVLGEFEAPALAASPNRGLVALGTYGGVVRLFDPAKGELSGPPLHGHLNGVHGVAFSPDGRRLISTSGGQEVVKIWDVGTRQELLTLAGTGSMLVAARWSADGNVILAGPPWQAWRAPSWAEIAAVEAGQKAESKKP